MNTTQSVIHFSTPYVFIAGSYHRSRNNDSLCRILGFELSKYNIGVISAGGKPGLQVTYSLDKALSDSNQYEPTKLLTFYRRKLKQDYLKIKRVGNIFIGKDVEEMRDAMLSKATVMIAIGGGNRTWEEIRAAEKLNIPVIPIGMSGGTAYAVWLEYQMSRQAEKHHVFSRLANKNPFIATDAIIDILKSMIILTD